MSNIEIVERLNKAVELKDWDVVNELLHQHYKLKDPMMEFNNREEFMAFMKDCPFSCFLENITFVEDGDKVVQTFDAVMTDPIAYTMRMCDILTIEDGKVKSEEMFYDTAKIPEEVKALTQKPTKKKAA